MRCLSFNYSSWESLKQYIKDKELKYCKGVIKIFANSNLELTTKVQNELKTLLPSFVIIGVAHNTNECDGEVPEPEIVVNLIIFEKNTQAIPFSTHMTIHSTRRAIIKELSGFAPRAIIFFTDINELHPGNLIDELQKSIPDCTFVGGHFPAVESSSSTSMLLNSECYEREIVGVAICGNYLDVQLLQNINYQPIGKLFTVTKSTEDTLISLNGMSILDIYKSYFGTSSIAAIESFLTKFPLVIHGHNKTRLIFPTRFCRNSQGLILDVNLNEGDRVTFAIDNSLLTTKQYEKLLMRKGVVVNSLLSRFEVTSPNFFKLRCNNNPFYSLDNVLYEQYRSIYTHVNGISNVANEAVTLLVLSESESESEVGIGKDTFFENINYEKYPSLLSNFSIASSKEFNKKIKCFEQHQQALNFSSIVSVTDKDGFIIYVNQKFENISGYSASELIGNTHQLIRHKDTKDKVFKSIWQTIKKQRPWQGVILNRRKCGSSYYVKTTIFPLLDENNVISKFISIRVDVTDLVKAKQLIKVQNKDSITGLPNRAKLNSEIVKKNIKLLAIFDAKNFKLINDFWGINIGDAVIKQISQLLSNYFSTNKSYSLFCINGASFGVITSANVTLQEFERICNRVKKNLEGSHFDVDDRAIELAFNVGIGFAESRVMEVTESAIYSAKKTLQSSLFTMTDQDTLKEEYESIECVRCALKENRLVIYFQRLAPVCSKEHQVDKFEALVRVNTNDNKVISPAFFLEHIKKTSLYGELTRKVITLAFDAVLEHDFVVSVNISIQDILDKKTVSFIYKKMEQLSGNKIIFEITESESISDFASVIHFIEVIRAFGAKIAIDDFGSGYSNFSYLVDIKPDYIKIDGSIIKEIINNKSSKQVTKSIIEMANALGIKTIAEFVSDEKTYNCLKGLGVDIVQGYYISKPKPLTDVRSN